MPDPSPLFSIVVALYNRAGFISRTIESALAQTVGEFELIVIDDGSTDGSGDVVKAIKDDRIKYYWKVNEERSVARNTGTMMATGKYISFLDSDDYLYPHHLAEAAAMIERYNGPEFFHLAYEIRDGNDGLMQSVDWLPEIGNDALITGNHLSMNGVFVRREIAQENLFDPLLTIHEDYELWLRLASRYSLVCGKAITSVVVAHRERSLLVTRGEELVRNIGRFEENIFSDAGFLEKYGSSVRRIKTNNRVHIALHYAVTKESRIKSLQYLAKGLATSPAALRNRAFYGTIKHLLF